MNNNKREKIIKQNDKMAIKIAAAREKLQELEAPLRKFIYEETEKMQKLVKQI